ncbi:MAG TPA: SulP family inorganic anion transporter [Anaerolineae bacterium]|nr:SulP family inorganic anion transporter [Anaerolineae bacterium]
MSTTHREQSLAPTGLSRWLPILHWLPRYDRSWLRGDVIAGLTVVALVVPEGMAYASLAGMPPETALYGAWIALVLYAIFGGSRQVVVGASSAIAVMSASIIAGLTPAGSAEFIALSMALALMAGLVAILAGLLRLGRIAQFFSESVLVGFVSGLALVIALKQVPKLFGLEAGEGNFWQRIVDLVTHLPETHLLTLAVGAGTLVLMLFLEHRFHRFPAALAALVFGIGASALFGLEALGVHVVGAIPAGLAGPQLPDVTTQQLVQLIPGALGITLVIFAEGIGPMRTFAGKYRYPLDSNQELIALGASNAGAGLFQSFAVGVSLSRSGANDSAGARSQVSGLVAAAITVAVALFLTPLFAPLPEATLAAIVVVAVARMVKWRAIRRLWQVRRLDFGLAMVTLLGVLTFDEVLTGLLVAVVISLLALVLRASQARLSVLGREPGSVAFSGVAIHPENTTVPGVLIVRPDEGLYFANAAPLRENIRSLALAADPPVTSVVVDLEMTNDLDAPSAHELAELHSDLEASGMHLMLARLRAPVRAVLDRSGATEEIGAENLHPRVLAAVAMHLNRTAGSQDALNIAGDSLQRLITVIDAQIEAASGDDRERLAALRRRMQEALDDIEPA